MSDVTLTEVKQLLESQAARDDRRREADVERFARFEGIVQTLTNEVAQVRRRQDSFEERQDRVERALSLADGKAREALDSVSHLEGRVIGAVNGFAERVNGKLQFQDREIEHIKKATDAQTAILTTLTKYMNGAEANTRLIKWLVPLTGGALAVVIPGLWYLFGLLSAAH